MRECEASHVSVSLSSVHPTHCNFTWSVSLNQITFFSKQYFFPSTSHVCKYHEPKRNASELTLVWGLGFLRRSWSVGHSAQWQVKTRLANCPLFNPNGFYGFAENKHYPVVHRLFTFLLVFINRMWSNCWWMLTCKIYKQWAQ